MKLITKLTLTATIACLATAGVAQAKISTGTTAADIQVVDSNGKIRSLSEFNGKTKVLEWTNDGCPYVKKHYKSGNMQKLQKEAAADGVVWLSVISSAPGKQGYVDGAGANKLTADRNASPHAVLLDSDGAAGRIYDAKTTPHMYIIDAQEKLVYQGAIDSNRSSSVKTIATATNYVSAALASIKAGTPIEKTESKPYGCSVKY